MACTYGSLRLADRLKAALQHEALHRRVSVSNTIKLIQCDARLVNLCDHRPHDRHVWKACVTCAPDRMRMYVSAVATAPVAALAAAAVAVAVAAKQLSDSHEGSSWAR